MRFVLGVVGTNFMVVLVVWATVRGCVAADCMVIVGFCVGWIDLDLYML